MIWYDIDNGVGGYWSLHDGGLACERKAEPYDFPVHLYPPQRNEFGKDMRAAHLEVSSEPRLLRGHTNAKRNN